jgi:hypothetical protein
MRHEILNVPILQPPQKTVVRWVQFFEGQSIEQRPTEIHPHDLNKN